MRKVKGGGNNEKTPTWLRVSNGSLSIWTVRWNARFKLPMVRHFVATDEKQLKLRSLKRSPNCGRSVNSQSAKSRRNRFKEGWVAVRKRRWTRELAQPKDSLKRGDELPGGVLQMVKVKRVLRGMISVRWAIGRSSETKG